MSSAKHFLPSTKLNTRSLKPVSHFPKTLLHQASQTKIWFDDSPLRVGYCRFKTAIVPKKWSPNLLNLPIDHLGAFTVILTSLWSEGSANIAFVWVDKLTAVMPAYSEWPLLLTTLRLLITGVLS